MGEAPEFEGSARGFDDPTAVLILADWCDELGLHAAASEFRGGQTDTAELPARGYGDGYGNGNGNGNGYGGNGYGYGHYGYGYGYGYGDGDGDGDG